MYFNAFHVNCVVSQSPGCWARDDDSMVGYNDIDQRINFAKRMAKAEFDTIFLGGRGLAALSLHRLEAFDRPSHEASLSSCTPPTFC